MTFTKDETIFGQFKDLAAERAQQESQGAVPVIALEGEDLITPNNPYPTRESIEQARQAPEVEWDPNNEFGLGMSGEELPEGAQSWDKYGRPYYGDGMEGYLKKFYYGLKRPKEAEEVEGPEEVSPEEWKTGSLPKRALAVAEHAIVNPIKKLDKGLQEGPLEAPYRALKSTIGLGLNTLQWVDDTRERMSGTVYGTLEEQAGKSDIPDVQGKMTETGLDLAEKTMQAFNVPEERIQQVRDIFDKGIELYRYTAKQIDPTYLLGKSAKSLQAMISGQLTPEEAKTITEDNWQAARIAYSNILYPTLREEFIREYRAGKDPGKLQIELENPIAEVLGEIMFDGTAVLGAMSALFGLKTARLERVKDAYDMLPEIKRAVEGADQISDATLAANKFEDIVSSVQNVAKQIGQDTFDKAHKTGLQEMLASSKRFVANERMQNLNKWIVANFGKNPDDALDIYKALMNIHDDNIDLVREAVDTLGHFKSNNLFSRASVEMGYFLRKGLENADGVVDANRFLSNLAEAAKDGDIESILKFVDSTHENAMKGLYKSVTQRIEDGEKVSNMARIASRIDEVAKVPQNLLNRFFSTVYMGISPAYAMRNMIQNTMQVVIDQGLKVGVEAAGAALGEIPAILRGKEHGIKYYSALEEIRKIAGQDVAAAVRGVGAAGGIRAVDEKFAEKLFGKFQFFIDAGNQFEQAASAIIVKNSLYNSMSKMLENGRAIPDVAELVAKGIPQETADVLANILKHTWGDTEAAMDIYKEAAKTGYVDLFKSGGWLNDIDTKLLNEFDLLETIRTAGNTAETKEEMLAMLDKIKKDKIDDVIEGLKKQPSIPNPANIEQMYGGEGLSDILKNMPDRSYAHTQSLVTARVYGNTQALDDWSDLAASVMKDVQANPEVSNMAQNLVGDQIPKIRRDASRQASRIRDRYNYAKQIVYSADQNDYMDDLVKAWKKAELPGEVPGDITKKEFFSLLWENYYPNINEVYAHSRDVMVEIYQKFIDAAKSAGVQIDEGLMSRALESTENAKRFDNAIVWDDNIMRTITESGDKKNNAIRKLFKEFGVSTASETGPKSDKFALNVLNKYGKKKYKSLDQVSFEEALDAVNEWGKAHGGKDFNLLSMDDIDQFLKGAKGEGAVEGAADVIRQEPKKLAEELIPPDTGGASPPARSVYMARDEIESTFEKIRAKVESQFGNVEEVVIDKNMKDVENWLNVANGRIADARAKSIAVATAERDFILLNYHDKDGFDRAMGYIMPYQYWYRRTYTNWLKRAYESPQVLGAYAKYRRTLEKLHAGMPEWWRYNINTNELLGLDMENPVYFNLEATLNPLNGLTGIDFDDPGRHPDTKIKWLTQTLDTAGKFGPTTWTPFNWLVALALHKQGEDEAAQKWAGRLIPGTSGVKAATHLLGVGPAGGVELDPFVNLLYGGFDAYERRRIGRGMATLMQDGEIPEAAAFDSAYYQDDENWDKATRVAADSRAWGQVASFFLGVGFKARTQQDMKIDQFYTEYNTLWGRSADLRPEEFKQSMDMLREKYPFMDTILLSRKGGYRRDEAYIYGVMSRIPPGQSDDLTELVGISGKMLNKFFEDKGIKNWSEQDRDRMVNGMLDMGAILDVPDTATRAEWTAAKNEYSGMNEKMKQIFGEDILEKIDLFFQQEDRDGYLKLNPDVEKALDLKSTYILQNELLSAYYASFDKVESYYKSAFYTHAEEVLGEDIFDKQTEYNWLKENGGDYKGYLKQHPELRKYWDMRRAIEKPIQERSASVAAKLPEAKPAIVRPDADPKSLMGMQFAEQMQQQQQAPPPVPWDTWKVILPDELSAAFVSGRELNDQEYDELAEIAETMGISTGDMIDFILQSVQR